MFVLLAEVQFAVIPEPALIVMLLQSDPKPFPERDTETVLPMSPCGGEMLLSCGATLIKPSAEAVQPLLS